MLISNRMVVLLVFLSISFSVPTYAADSAVRSYPIPNHGALEFAAPSSWKDSINQPPGGLPPTIRFVPENDNQFKLLVTVLWSMKPGENINEPARLKALVNTIGQRVLPTAVEKELNILELKHGDSIGYYFLVTDKAPKPGEFRYMAQGVIGMGELQLSFTLLLNEKDSNEQRSALDMLIKAKHKK